VGSVGIPDGFSTVIVRSALGERLLEGIEFERQEVRRDDVAKLAALKRKKAEKSSEGGYLSRAG
jgi:coenzyme F420-reducing hydrogenase beta subunit